MIYRKRFTESSKVILAVEASSLKEAEKKMNDYWVENSHEIRRVMDDNTDIREDYLQSPRDLKEYLRYVEGGTKNEILIKTESEKCSMNIQKCSCENCDGSCMKKKNCAEPEQSYINTYRIHIYEGKDGPLISNTDVAKSLIDAMKCISRKVKEYRSAGYSNAVAKISDITLIDANDHQSWWDITVELYEEGIPVEKKSEKENGIEELYNGAIKAMQRYSNMLKKEFGDE